MSTARRYPTVVAELSAKKQSYAETIANRPDVRALMMKRPPKIRVR